MTLTSQLPPSLLSWPSASVQSYPLYPIKHCKLNVSQIELCLSPSVLLLSKPASYLHLHSSLSRWYHHPEIYKSHRTPPSLSPTFHQPSSLASFSSSILPNPPFVLVLLTQTISTTLWLFFLPPGVHSPQSNVSKMQIWPRHFSAWILSAVTIHFKLSSGLKSSHDLLLPCSSLYLTLELQQNAFRSLNGLMVYILHVAFVILSASPSFFTWLTFIYTQSSFRYFQIELSVTMELSYSLHCPQ